MGLNPSPAPILRTSSSGAANDRRRNDTRRRPSSARRCSGTARSPPNTRSTGRASTCAAHSLESTARVQSASSSMAPTLRALPTSTPSPTAAVSTFGAVQSSTYPSARSRRYVVSNTATSTCAPAVNSPIRALKSLTVQSNLLTCWTASAKSQTRNVRLPPTPGTRDSTSR